MTPPNTHALDALQEIVGMLQRPNGTFREHASYIANAVRIAEEAIAALTPSRADTAEKPVALFTLGQARSLVDCFGGSNAEVLIFDYPEARITDDDDNPMPAGLYAVFADYPEEGATYLGEEDADAEFPAPAGDAQRTILSRNEAFNLADTVIEHVECGQMQKARDAIMELANTPAGDAQGAVDVWKPIHTAPKDGETTLLFYTVETDEVEIGIRPIDCPDDAAADSSMHIAFYPDYWASLPPAPVGIAAAPTPEAPRVDANVGYVEAFYEMGGMLGFGAMPISPKEAWEQHIRPKLAALVAGCADEDAYVIEKLGRLLAEISITLNGPNLPNGLWSYHDLPAKVEALAVESRQCADEMDAWSEKRLSGPHDNRNVRRLLGGWAERLRAPAPTPEAPSVGAIERIGNATREPVYLGAPQVVTDTPEAPLGSQAGEVTQHVERLMALRNEGGELFVMPEDVAALDAAINALTTPTPADSGVLGNDYFDTQCSGCLRRDCDGACMEAE